MYSFEQWVYATIIADPTLASLLASPAGSPTTVSVYPSAPDITPEQFPSITYMDSGSILDSTTRLRIGRMRLDTWSRLGMGEIMPIYSRLAQLLNFEHSRIANIPVPNNNTLFWNYEVSTRDQPDTTRRMFRKVCVFKYWVRDPLLLINPI